MEHLSVERPCAPLVRESHAHVAPVGAFDACFGFCLAGCLVGFLFHGWFPFLVFWVGGLIGALRFAIGFWGRTCRTRKTRRTFDFQEANAFVLRAWFLLCHCMAQSTEMVAPGVVGCATLFKRFSCQRSMLALRLGADWRLSCTLALPPITCPLG